MITFDYLALKAFYEENKEFFENARIQKIQSPSRKDLILFLRGLGETRKFYININPQFYHICFKSKENEKASTRIWITRYIVALNSYSMLTKFHLLNDRHACFSMSKYICTLSLALLSLCGFSLCG